MKPHHPDSWHMMKQVEKALLQVDQVKLERTGPTEVTVDLKGSPFTIEEFKEFWEAEISKSGKWVVPIVEPLPFKWVPDPVDLLDEHLLPRSIKDTGWASPPIPAPKGKLAPAVLFPVDYGKILQSEIDRGMEELWRMWDRAHLHLLFTE